MRVIDRVVVVTSSVTKENKIQSFSNFIVRRRTVPSVFEIKLLKMKMMRILIYLLQDISVIVL